MTINKIKEIFQLLGLFVDKSPTNFILYNVNLNLYCDHVGDWVDIRDKDNYLSCWKIVNDYSAFVIKNLTYDEFDYLIIRDTINTAKCRKHELYVVPAWLQYPTDNFKMSNTFGWGKIIPYHSDPRAYAYKY